MPTKIQLKRGIKDNLPVLNQGEAAFTTDTKEFYIGDGSNNYNMTPIGKNLLANSNFQYLTQEGDYYSPALYWLTPQKSLYFHGNYYISNKAALGTANSRVTVADQPVLKTGLKTLGCSAAKPVIEYRIKLPKYTAQSIDYYRSQYEDTIFTISFDIRNLSSDPFSFQVGCPSNLVTVTCKKNNELERVSATFKYNRSLTNGAPITYGYHSFILFSKTDELISRQIDIGNFKLELGSKASEYTFNSLEEDMMIVNGSFYTKQAYFRAAEVAYDKFIIYVSREVNDFLNFDVRVNILSAIVYDTHPNSQPSEITGFTWTVDDTFSSTITKVTFTKTDHGLFDIGVLLKYTVDLRPYY